MAKLCSTGKHEKVAGPWKAPSSAAFSPISHDPQALTILHVEAVRRLSGNDPCGG